MKKDEFKLTMKKKQVIRVFLDEKGVKEDLNFLEFPTAVLDDKNACLVFELKSSRGTYTIGSIDGLATHFDKRVWFFLLHKLYKDGISKDYEFSLTRYEIAKNVIDGDRHPSQEDCDRIMLSLKKWAGISINFDGSFYMEGKHYSRMFYHMLDAVRVDEKTLRINIRFNKEYLTQLQNSNHYALFNFEEYVKISIPAAARLYELCVKNFQLRASWEINLDTLAVKMPLAKRKNAKRYYPSDVIPLLEKGIKEINAKTSLKVLFNFDKQEGKCSFNGPILRPVEKTKKVTKQVVVQPAVHDKSSRISVHEDEALKKEYYAYKIAQGEAIAQTLSKQELQQFQKQIQKSNNILGSFISQAPYTAEEALYFNIGDAHMDKILSFEQYLFAKKGTVNVSNKAKV